MVAQVEIERFDYYPSSFLKKKPTDDHHTLAQSEQFSKLSDCMSSVKREKQNISALDIVY